MITIHDKTFELYIPAQAIRARVREMGQAISADFSGRRPLFICVLSGSFMFAADLLRELSIDAEIAFVKLGSYSGTASTGVVTTTLDLSISPAGRDVVVIEDIIDTGATLSHFLNALEKQNVESVKIAALLVKPAALKYAIVADYAGFSIGNEFVVGYGLDYDGLGRNYADIYQQAGLL